MILKDFAPDPSLNEFVRCYRIVHFKFAHVQEPIQKAYAPRPEVCLHFFLRERELIQIGETDPKDYQYPVVLAGQQTSVINRYLIGGDFMTFNIVFQPTALFRLTGISSFELTDQYIDAEQIFSAKIRLVHEQLQGAVSYQEMISIANAFVSSRARQAKREAHRLDNVSRLMLKCAGENSLDWLATESCLSVKQFTRKFYERTGVTPKTYQRIIRFTKALNLKNAFPKREWAQIAFDCGYVDYQHLAKDYKTFTRHTPHDFHLLENKSPEQRLGLASEVYKSRATL